MLRSRHATIPEVVGRTGYERQKLGGGARASPPHKTLSVLRSVLTIPVQNPRSTSPAGNLMEASAGSRGG